MDVSEIRSLLKLLDDENSEIVSVVRRKLLEGGASAIPILEEAIPAASSVLKDRIQSIVAEIVASDVKTQLTELLHTPGDIDLESSALLLARYGYPNEDLRWCSRLLDEYAHELDSKLDTHHDPIEILSIIVRFLGAEKGFRGDMEDYYNPDNSYLNRVLEKKTGLPISLCTIYLLVGKRLNIPLYGIGMPGHFLIKYRVGEEEIFVDPFKGGKLLSRNDCREFLELTGLGFREEFLETVSHQQMVDRMIRNLIVAYRQRGELQHVAALRSFLEVIQNKGGS